jgi:hypothetical protein
MQSNSWQYLLFKEVHQLPYPGIMGIFGILKADIPLKLNKRASIGIEENAGRLRKRRIMHGLEWFFHQSFYLQQFCIFLSNII